MSRRSELWLLAAVGCLTVALVAVERDRIRHTEAELNGVYLATRVDELETELARGPRVVYTAPAVPEPEPKPEP